MARSTRHRASVRRLALVRLMSIVFVGMVILLRPSDARAYDGDETYAEGWTYRVCGLDTAQLGSLPIHACPDRVCPAKGRLRENDLVFVYGEDADGPQRWVTPVDAFTVFVNLDTHKGPFGYVYGKFLCDDVPRPETGAGPRP